MTFLDPIFLWALPLLLAPVIIHLVNRMRHQTMPWAAMRFLITANRNSMNQARLRQWIVLLLRVLAVLALVLFLARPLAGGWIGWAFASAPDAILVLLDRSASMESVDRAGGTSRRLAALRLLSAAAKPFERRSHLLLIDSATRIPQTVGSISALEGLDAVQPTDSAADIPAMLEAALKWMLENKAGATEIWIASDLQRGNWQPEDGRWKSINARFASLPQKIRFRLLAVQGGGEGNASLSLVEARRVNAGGSMPLDFTAEVQRTAAEARKLPVKFTLGGQASQLDWMVQGSVARVRGSLPLAATVTNGWGSFELPADANPADNTTWFAFGPPSTPKALVFAEDRRAGRLLALASGASGALEPSKAADSDFSSASLVVWQGPLPAEPLASRLRQMAQEGGVLLMLPPLTDTSGVLEGVSWSTVESAAAGKSFRVVKWNEDQGPLGRTGDGAPLPLPETSFSQRRTLSTTVPVIAAFEDGRKLLARQTLGRGECYWLTSLPVRTWSSLDEGLVLVPMVRRLAADGTRRLQPVLFAHCGELTAAELSRQWEPVSTNLTAAARPQSKAGVYRSGGTLLAVNRPASEDSQDSLELTEANQLFGKLSLVTLAEKGSGSKDDGQSEIWRMVLAGMLLFLLVEGFLILPAPPAPVAHKQ